MRIQDAVDKWTMECVFRTVVNAATATQTATANTIGQGMPLILATNTASLPAVNTGTTLPGTNINNFVTRPATATAVVNNLFLGLLYSNPGTKAYLGAEEIGIAQCYGPYIGAVVKRGTTSGDVQSPGGLLIPDYDVVGALVPQIAPLTSTSTNNLSGVGVSGLAYQIQSIASSGATETTTGIVFLRCM